jgi:hypothetical protein
MRTLQELEQIDPAIMTADELLWLRLIGAPVHCQTMQRASRFDTGAVVFSDIEAVSREVLDQKIESCYRAGWRLSGTYFVRQRKTKTCTGAQHENMDKHYTCANCGLNWCGECFPSSAQVGRVGVCPDCRAKRAAG